MNPLTHDHPVADDFEPNCFPRQQLLEFTLGKLDNEVSQVIASHIDECETCEETVVGFDNAEDTLVGKLAKELLDRPSESNHDDPNKRDGETDKPKLGALIQRLKRRDFRDSGNGFESVAPLSQQISEYRIIDAIGRGGMGTVYRATHNRLEKDVALKVLPERKIQNPESISRFRREMKIIGQLDHPSIVQATDAGEDQGVHYLAMEFVDGFDLSRLTKLVPQIDDATYCELIRQTAEGIEYVHSKNVVHRDIKPSNLMLSKDGTIKILDLGLAMLSGMHGVVDELTTVGQLMGTIDYMAPEQYGDCHLVDHRADIYAIGATLFRLLSGEAPFAGKPNESPLQKLKRIATETIPSISFKRPDLDPQLAAVVDRCLSREKSDRFDSAKDVANALRPYSDDRHLTEIVAKAKSSSDTESDRKIQGCGRESLLLPEKKQTENPELSELVSKVTKLQTSVDSNNKNQNRWWLKAGAAIAVLFAAIFCGIIIQIELDKGNLVIESDSANVKVALLKDGKVYDQMELVQGTNSTKIRAGKYEVVIDEASEKMVVDNNVFKLTRGETIVAKITRSPSKILNPLETAARDSRPTKNPKSSTNNQQLSEPVYQGLTLGQWLAKIKSDVLDAKNAGSTDVISASPIVNLIEGGSKETVRRAVEFWVSVIQNEASINQLYRLTPVFNALAYEDSNADLITDAFVERLMKFREDQVASSRIRYSVVAKSTSSAVQSRTAFRTISGEFSLLFQRWSNANLMRIERHIFESKHKGSESANAIRRSFLSRVVFNPTSKAFNATHENITNLIKLSKAEFKDGMTFAIQAMEDLIRKPSSLSESTRVMLQSRIEEMVRDSNIQTKSAGIRMLSQLAPDSPGLVNEIESNLAQHPQLISSLGRLNNPKRAIDRIQQLISDEDWGWDQETKMAASIPMSSYGGGGGSSAMSGMLGGGGGAGMMGAGVISNVANREDARRIMQAMMGGNTAQSKISYSRLILVSYLPSLGKNGTPLLPILRKQQELTANTEYLTLVWEAINAISGEKLPELFNGRELSVWKKQLESPKSEAELAMAILACGEMIGEIHFERRWNRSRSARSRSSAGYLGEFKSIENPRPKNNNDYVNLLKSILPKIRHLDFNEFAWDNSNKKELAYSDPRAAAYLLSQKFVLALIETADVKDFPFLITLDPAVDVSAYRSFQRTAFNAAPVGSLQEARLAWDMYDKEFEDILLSRFSNPNANLITRLVTLYRLFEWETDRRKFENGFKNLIAKHPVETLAVLQKRSHERAVGSIKHYTETSTLLFRWLTTADNLDTIGAPGRFENSQSVFRGNNWMFDDEGSNSSTNIARVLDCIELGDARRDRKSMLQKLLVFCFEEAEMPTIDAVKTKLQSILPKTDTVTATRIESILQTLEKVDVQLENLRKRELDRKAADEKKKKRDAQLFVDSAFGSDRNKDKVLDKDELKMFNQAPTALEYIMSADVNKDGKVSEAELLEHAIETPFRKPSQ